MIEVAAGEDGLEPGTRSFAACLASLVELAPGVLAVGDPIETLETT